MQRQYIRQNCTQVMYMKKCLLYTKLTKHSFRESVAYCTFQIQRNSKGQIRDHIMIISSWLAVSHPHPCHCTHTHKVRVYQLVYPRCHKMNFISLILIFYSVCTLMDSGEAATFLIVRLVGWLLIAYSYS